MFTPVQTFLGAVLLHLSSTSLLRDTGRVLGISGILDGALRNTNVGGRAWRWAMLAGLALGPVLLRLAKMTGFGKHGAWLDSGVEAWTAQSLARLSLAGLLVGFGSRVGRVKVSGERRADDGSSGQAVRGMYGVTAEQYHPQLIV
jgi:hypothetical protein